jgi:hypothetical protein
MRLKKEEHAALMQVQQYVAQRQKVITAAWGLFAHRVVTAEDYVA